MGLSCPSPGPLLTPHSGLPVPSRLLSLKTHYHHHPTRPIHLGLLSSLPSQSPCSCHLHNYPCPTSLPLTSLTSHPSPSTGFCNCGRGSPNTARGQGHYPEEVSLCTCISVHQRDVTPRQRDAPKTAAPIFFFSQSWIILGSPESMNTLTTATEPLPTCLTPQLPPGDTYMG